MRSCFGWKRFFLLLGMIGLSASCAKGDPVVIMDIEQARDRIDFRIQGEYEGVLFDQPVALQVAARGAGRFEGLFYAEGLPGAGWDGQDPVAMAGERLDDRLILEGGGITARYEDGRFTVRSADGGTGTLEPVYRSSPHEGARPPDGAVVLFEGSSLDAFQPGARLTDEGWLWEGATSRDPFGDLTLHVEFMIGFMPEAAGPRRANSGIYLQQRYEVQILDSFGELPTPRGMASLYNVQAPELNMTYPPLQWQTYRILFSAPRFDGDGNKIADARVTVVHNGLRVQDDVPLSSGTGRASALEEVPTAPINFQRHGPQPSVVFRNIWLTTP